MKVRDKLWLFASRAHDDDVWLGKSDNNRFTRWSRITPTEGACMLDIPNIIMVGSDGDPVPYSAEARGYLESFCRMRKVMWSVTGSSGFRVGNEEDFVCDFADQYPNLSGVFADDIVMGGDLSDMNTERKEKQKKNLKILEKITSTLKRAPRPMDFWVTVYMDSVPIEDQIANLEPEFWKPFTGLSLWTWSYKNLKQLPQKFDLVKKAFPDKDISIGIYLFDYPSGEPIPNEYMELQCEFALEKLRSGEASDIIFLTNCVMGVGLPSEYWLRDWIQKVKDIEIAE